MIIIGIILGVYCVLIAVLSIGIMKLPQDVTKQTIQTQAFSIVVPFRNEEIHLPKLIQSIILLDYPTNQFEVLFVDDESSDNSVKIIHQSLKNSQINYQVLANYRQSQSPKKDAITTAIKIAVHEWILTTDADCILPSKWLKAYNSKISDSTIEMVVGPVTFPKAENLVQHYQLLDNLSLQGTTMGGFGIGKPFLSNGANFGYKKTLFEALDGFQNNNHIASGDDMFMLENTIKNNSKSVGYLKSKDAIVLTHYESTWKHVISQRVRWASKTGSYKFLFPKLIGLIVFLVNFFVVIVFASSLFEPTLWPFFLGIAGAKLLVDFLLMSISAQFLKKRISLGYFIINSAIYPILNGLIVLKFMTSSYQWKGRTFKK